MLIYGDFIPINKKEEIHYLKKAVDKEHACAMITFAGMIKNGEIPSVNKEESNRYYKKAIPIIKKRIDNGDADAMRYFDRMLHDGNGVEVDLKEAYHYFKMAADKGDAD